MADGGSSQTNETETTLNVQTDTPKIAVKESVSMATPVSPYEGETNNKSGTIMESLMNAAAEDHTITGRKRVAWVAEDFKERLKNGDVKEENIKHLTPKRGKKVIINEEITKIRYILDQFEDTNPIIALNHSFDFKRAMLEFIYNYFYIFAFPLILYNEGKAGFHAREFGTPFGIIAFLAFMTSDVVYFGFADRQVRLCFWYPLLIMNILNICRVSVIAIKYGYYVPCIFKEYNHPTHPISTEYIWSLHLSPGWVAQSPLCMAREIWMTEQHLNINISDLRMNFRDTKAFDLYKAGNCSCSRYWTKLDWFIPFVYVYTKSGSAVASWGFYLGTITALILLSFYSTFARLMPYSDSPATFADCGTQCWILVVLIPITLGTGLGGAVLWVWCMAIDFTRRFERMKLCTHLIDPKRDTFQTPEMKKKYRVELFGSVVDFKKKHLESLDLHTIDFCSADTLYSWSQFRKSLFEVGHFFLLREQAYNAVLLLFAVLCLVFFLTSLVDSDIVVIWEDLFLTLVLIVCVLLPSMWTLSCENSLNYQTMKQQRILSERALELYHFENDAKKKGLDYWVIELQHAREMCEAIADSLSQNDYFIRFLGIKVDWSAVQLIATLILILFYITGMTLYEQGWFGNFSL